MPLRRGRGVHQAGGAIVFMMRDTSEIVFCKISAAARSQSLLYLRPDD